MNLLDQNLQKNLDIPAELGILGDRDTFKYAMMILLDIVIKQSDGKIDIQVCRDDSRRL